MSGVIVNDLSFRYGSADAPALECIQLQIAPGETCMIVGDNGSGKTTLGRLLTGILRPHSGSVLIDDKRIHDLPVSERPRYAVYMGQTSYLQFFRASIAEEIEFACSLTGTSPDAIASAYERFYLPAYRAAEPAVKPLAKPAVKPMDLSYPEMWRLQLFLMSVAFNPSVLFVDEVVAPRSSVQQEVLQYVLDRRTRAGQVTFVAYQRPLQGFPQRTFTLESGKLAER